MTSLRSWFVSVAIVAALLAGLPALAQAQASAPAQTQSSGGSSILGGRATVHFNVGLQTGSGDLAQTFTPIIYDEPASINVAQTYETGGLTLAAGETLYLYTDGVTEAHNRTDELFAEQRLEAVLREAAGNSTNIVVTAVGDAVRRFADGAPQSDDITTMALRWLGDSVDLGR